jgi:hypothetical protein
LKSFALARQSVDVHKNKKLAARMAEPMAAMEAAEKPVSRSDLVDRPRRVFLPAQERPEEGYGDPGQEAEQSAEIADLERDGFKLARRHQPRHCE